MEARRGAQNCQRSTRASVKTTGPLRRTPASALHSRWQDEPRFLKAVQGPEELRVPFPVPCWTQRLGVSQQRRPEGTLCRAHPHPPTARALGQALPGEPGGGRQQLV